MHGSPHILTPVFSYHSFHPPLSPSSILLDIICVVAPSCPVTWECQPIRLAVISAKNLKVSPERIPQVSTYPSESYGLTNL
ncbi:hypothetical protein BDR03DRAFT_970490 [Suillus americanus]|nr:hypothetical protein BDR03DRAFT_970490 [Suillus americanus]